MIFKFIACQSGRMTWFWSPSTRNDDFNLSFQYFLPERECFDSSSCISSNNSRLVIDQRHASVIVSRLGTCDLDRDLPIESFASSAVSLANNDFVMKPGNGDC